MELVIQWERKSLIQVTTHTNIEFQEPSMLRDGQEYIYRGIWSDQSQKTKISGESLLGVCGGMKMGINLQW